MQADGMAEQEPLPNENEENGVLLTEPEWLAAKAVANACTPISKEQCSTRTHSNVLYIDSIIHSIGDSKFVLIGESTHGTHEFYEMRATITKAIIQQKAAKVVCIEGDWPCVEDINAYVLGLDDECKAKNDRDRAIFALRSFKDRFPEWMWRNDVFIEFIQWLRAYNKQQQQQQQDCVYVCGLDMQHQADVAIARIVSVLSKHCEKDVVEKVSQLYATICVYTNGHTYTDHLRKQQQVSQQQNVQDANTIINGIVASKKVPQGEAFSLERCAAMVTCFELYYRSMLFESNGQRITWNIRDQFFFDTMLASRQYARSEGVVVCWAHNSHIGDASATEFEENEVNLGSLVRSVFSVQQCYNIGFSTYKDSLTASTHWGGPTLKQTITEAVAHSYGHLFHGAFLMAGGVPCESDLQYPHVVEHVLQVKRERTGDDTNGFLLVMRSNNPFDILHDNSDFAFAHECLLQPRLQRAIGVQYKQHTEHQSHYFSACVPLQFDAMIHIDHTHALVPLDNWANV